MMQMQQLMSQLYVCVRQVGLTLTPVMMWGVYNEALSEQSDQRQQMMIDFRALLAISSSQAL